MPGANIGAHGIPEPVDPYADTKDFVRASALGGSASLNLIPPSGGGPMTLTVASLDWAYNRSPAATYSFDVKSTDPTIEHYGTPVTVKAGRGHAATISWMPDQSGFTDLEVYATTEDGPQLTPYDYFFTVS